MIFSASTLRELGVIGERVRTVTGSLIGRVCNVYRSGDTLDGSPLVSGVRYICVWSVIVRLTSRGLSSSGTSANTKTSWRVCRTTFVVPSKMAYLYPGGSNVRAGSFLSVFETEGAGFGADSLVFCLGEEPKSLSVLCKNQILPPNRRTINTPILPPQSNW